MQAKQAKGAMPGSEPKRSEKAPNPFVLADMSAYINSFELSVQRRRVHEPCIIVVHPHA
jgi:hypothetical protein